MASLESSWPGRSARQYSASPLPGYCLSAFGRVGALYGLAERWSMQAFGTGSDLMAVAVNSAIRHRSR